MNILKNKLLYITLIAGLALVCILSLAFYPAYNPKPKDLPIAIVNLDQGMDIQGKSTNIGKTFTDNIKDNKELAKSVKFVTVKSKDDLKEGFEDNKYYSAIIIPQNFTQDATSAMRSEIQTAKKAEAKAAALKAQTDLQAKVQSGQVTPQQAQQIGIQMKQKMEQMQKQNADLLKPITVKKGEIEIQINQGASAQAATISDKMLSTMGEKINTMLSKQTVTQLDKNNIKVAAKDMDALLNPVTTKHTTLNKIKDHQANGMGGMLLFTPVWMGSLVSAILLFFAFRTSHLVKRSERIIATLFQIGMAALAAFISSFGGVWFITQVLDFYMPEPMQTATYIFIAMFGFIMLILGVMAWLGMKAVPLFMVLLFFSMQMLTLPKQMLHEFYQKYVLTWDPFSFYVEGLRELIYLNKDLSFNTPVAVMVGLAIFGIISTLLAAAIRKHSEKRAELPA
ncbi:ABC-2 type transporter transmembrane domain-containing protein [Macrococcoides canis]|uniref:ABC-2 family transporter protein n=1 Tax=Macrococcoides canis TaxID=1855823 RepID=A0A1W7A9H0_9STAP|nr:ABC transporter permease [Macrococcus canis]ARQ05760.1 ABC-2 family transporter protein [Macrococcus canis]